MSYERYTVTLTDLATFKLTVAAYNPDEAASIAKTALYEEATRLPSGMTIVKRETEANVELAPDVAARQFRVDSTYRLDFSMTVPASDATEAELHARRLYVCCCGPFEFENANERVGPYTVREVVS
jgi:hypothetical protein